MPELPEVEASRYSISSICTGQSIKSVILLEQGNGPRHGLFDDIVCTSTETDLCNALIGKTLTGVFRKGKQLWFTLSESPIAVLFHFGMTGAFIIKGQEIPSYKSFQISPEWPPKFTKLELIFDDDIRIAFCDPRRLGRIQLRTNPLDVPPISLLAKDPFIDEITIEYLQSSLLRYKAPIKSILLDQEKIFCGIGNYIADEVLYHAKLHPNNICKHIGLDNTSVQNLLNSIQYVISYAVSVNADYKKFPSTWLFHYRWGKKAGTLPNGNPITFITIGSRTSAVVLKEQHMIPKNTQLTHSYIITTPTPTITPNPTSKYSIHRSSSCSSSSNSEDINIMTTKKDNSRKLTDSDYDSKDVAVIIPVIKEFTSMEGYNNISGSNPNQDHDHEPNDILSNTPLPLNNINTTISSSSIKNNKRKVSLVTNVDGSNSSSNNRRIRKTIEEVATYTQSITNIDFQRSSSRIKAKLLSILK